MFPPLNTTTLGDELELEWNTLELVWNVRGIGMCPFCSTCFQSAESKKVVKNNNNKNETIQPQNKQQLHITRELLKSIPLFHLYSNNSLPYILFIS